MSILSGIAPVTVAIENTVAELDAPAAEQSRKWRAISRRAFCPVLSRGAWLVTTRLRAARQVGGDFYDFLPLPRDHQGLVVADVADKGVPAALFMAVCRTLTRSVAIGGHRTPAEALKRVNELILADARSDLFVTMFLADLSPVGRYANAGTTPSSCGRYCEVES
jgi:serine phosphatase RsbU (regulator of sigma subunit)